MRQKAEEMALVFLNRFFHGSKNITDDKHFKKFNQKRTHLRVKNKRVHTFTHLFDAFSESLKYEVSIIAKSYRSTILHGL